MPWFTFLANDGCPWNAPPGQLRKALLAFHRDCLGCKLHPNPEMDTVAIDLTRETPLRESTLKVMRAALRDFYLHEARAERDEARRQLRAGQVESEQRAQAERADLERRYHKLLQEHMGCGITIAKFEAQVAEYLAFMERFRSSLQREEYG